VPESTGLGALVDEVVIGEAVVLDVPSARFPSRMIALVIDLACQFVLLFIFFLITGAAMAGGGLDVASGAAVGLTGAVLILVGYPATFETLTRGKSLGKLALGLRVVSDDGGPERFRQALVRALIALLEIFLTVGFVALLTSLLSAKGKRLGDIFAGTFVIQERLPGRKILAAPLATVPPALIGWAATLHLSGLTDATAETARGYLSRFHELTPAARDEFGQRIAAAVQAQVTPLPPPGTPPAAYLTAVLAERRAREHARLMAHRPYTVGPSLAGVTGTSPAAPGATAVAPGAASQPAAQQPLRSEEPADPQQAPQQRDDPAATRHGGFQPPA
jgi:uncharacterized RDD family membrane protein YckC